MDNQFGLIYSARLRPDQICMYKKQSCTRLRRPALMSRDWEDTEKRNSGKETSVTGASETDDDDDSEFHGVPFSCPGTPSSDSNNVSDSENASAVSSSSSDDDDDEWAGSDSDRKRGTCKGLGDSEDFVDKCFGVNGLDFFQLPGQHNNQHSQQHLGLQGGYFQNQQNAPQGGNAPPAYNEFFRQDSNMHDFQMSEFFSGSPCSISNNGSLVAGGSEWSTAYQKSFHGYTLLNSNEATTGTSAENSPQSYSNEGHTPPPKVPEQVLIPPTSDSASLSTIFDPCTKAKSFVLITSQQASTSETPISHPLGSEERCVDLMQPRRATPRREKVKKQKSVSSSRKQVTKPTNLEHYFAEFESYLDPRMRNRLIAVVNYIPLAELVGPSPPKSFSKMFRYLRNRESQSRLPIINATVLRLKSEDCLDLLNRPIAVDETQLDSTTTFLHIFVQDSILHAGGNRNNLSLLEDDLRIFKFLLGCGADPYIRNYEIKGDTLIHYMARIGDETASFLKIITETPGLFNKEKFFLKNFEGKSALEVAYDANGSLSNSGILIQTCIISQLMFDAQKKPR
ncbi:unnamed protein product [Notodromas monacha]|uniref:Uncharacterized protein n=1 Tax=Notodromas monacha TaxID=399045 RepID=A0A7R9BWC3_9CRUS|nr:unnamed protein product [Notodromas monacha]CAG0921995.1 unnamed protein product [Notodromas monacha]